MKQDLILYLKSNDLLLFKLEAYTKRHYLFIYEKF